MDKRAASGKKTGRSPSTTPGLAVRFFEHIEAAIERDGHFTRNDRRDAKRFGTNEPRIRRLIHGLRADGILKRVSEARRTQNARGEWFSAGEQYILTPSVGSVRSAIPHRASEMTPSNAYKSDASIGSTCSDAGADAPTLAAKPLATHAADADSQPSLSSIPDSASTLVAKPLAISTDCEKRSEQSERSDNVDDVGGYDNGKPCASAPLRKGRAREGKPETVEEKLVLDLYEQGNACRHNDSTEWRHDRGKSLTSLRNFLHRRKGVSYTSVTKRLMHAFDSDSRFPLYDRPFALSKFFYHWDEFANGPLKKAPAKKSVAQVIQEKHDRPLRDDIADFGEEWWQKTRESHRIGEFEEFTGYTIAVNSDEVCLGFLAQIGWGWQEYMMDGSTISPAMLMTKLVDACMQSPRTPFPSDFIPHRDRLREEET